MEENTVEVDFSTFVINKFLTKMSQLEFANAKLEYELIEARQTIEKLESKLPNNGLKDEEGGEK